MRFAKPVVALVGVSSLALAAGVVAGTLVSRLPATAVVARDTSPLSAELQLTDGQRDQMRQLWEGVRQTAHQCQLDAQQLQKQRDDAVFAMLNDEQKAKYLKVNTECFGKIAALNAKREAAFTEAVSKTKGILNDTQRRKYEELIKSRLGPDAGPSADDSMTVPVRANEVATARSVSP